MCSAYRWLKKNTSRIGSLCAIFIHRANISSQKKRAVIMTEEWHISNGEIVKAVSCIWAMERILINIVKQSYRRLTTELKALCKADSTVEWQPIQIVRCWPLKSPGKSLWHQMDKNFCPRTQHALLHPAQQASFNPFSSILCFRQVRVSEWLY